MKNLFNLIQNLTQSEKRYVTIRLSGTKASSDSLQYFELLANQSRYDFSELKTVSDKKDRVLRSNLDKLYRSILRQLRIFHSEKNNESKLQGQLLDVNILKEKGLITEAKKLNAKLIKSSKEKEEFPILKKALANHWILLHLSGMLSIEATQELESEIEDCKIKEVEIDELNQFYRRGVSLYYSYFFKSKKASYLEDIKELLKYPRLENVGVLKSDNAQMVGFEVVSLCYMMLGDLANHHQTRKKQLKLLLSSPIFKTDFLNQLLVMSNLFTFLKTKGEIKEFTAYLEVFEKYFKPIVSSVNDSVLTEKFYDVYFQNTVYKHQVLNVLVGNDELIEQFETAVENGDITNRILIARAYLSLVELALQHSDFKKAIHLLITYQDLDKANKSSKLFIDSELFYLYIFKCMKKLDSYENKLITFDKYIKNKGLTLDAEQELVREVIEKDIEISSDQRGLIKKKIYQIITSGTAADTIFQNNEYQEDQDELLQILKNEIKN